MGYKTDPRYNSSGCYDPTAYDALDHIEREERKRRAEVEADKRFRKVLAYIFHVCKINGLEIEGRIVVRDIKTGKVWR